MLKNPSPNLWLAEDDEFLVGQLQIGVRMTVIRLSDGNLFVHSPIAVTKPLKDALASIGTPKYIIAPNTTHNLFARQFKDEYPDAELYVVPELKKKMPELSFAKDLLGDGGYTWDGEIKQHAIKGIPKSSEVAFLHKESRSLILTDLAFNLTSDKPFLTRLFFRLNGAYDKFTPSRLFKLFFLKDKAAFRKSIDHILGWDFDRIIISHGNIVEKDGKAVFREAFGKV